MTKCLITHREAFLALVMDTKNSSAIEGINRRFPEAWNRREKQTLYKHLFFKDSVVIKEYRLNLAYCLFEYAKTDENLKSVLADLLIKKEQKLYRVLKTHYKNKTIKIEEIFKLIQMEETIGNVSVETYKKLAIVDFFLDYMGISYVEECEEESCFGLLQQKGYELVNGNSASLNETFLQLRQQLKRENSESYKLYKSYFRQYIDFLNLTQNNFLSFDYLCENNNETRLFLQIGNKIEAGKTRLTLQEGIELIGLIRSYQHTISPMLNDQDKLMDSDIDFIKNNLNQALMFYLQMKNYEHDRDYFFKHYYCSDNTIQKTLEKELERERNKVRQLENKNETLMMKLATIKVELEKEYNKRHKKMDADLITWNREKEKLRLENERLKVEIKRLQQSDENTHLEKNKPVLPVVEMDIDLEVINDPSILIVGGATATIQRLKQKLPNCKYFEVDQKYNDHFFNGIKQAILLTNIMNHGMTYRVDKLCPKIPKKSVGSTNVDLIIQEIAIQSHTINEHL